LAAKALGYSLLALSWGNVLGSDNPDKTLAKILEVADCLDRCILLGDDFDKGFTGWEEGGVSRRLSQRLLTWMQEHTSNVMLMATVNRIKLLPSEIKRRFDDGGIWFVDLPDMGAMYEIFRLHLAKYFPLQFAGGNEPWNDREWYGLLKKYRGATPVEIAHAVERCAQDFYCGLSEEEREKAAVSAQVTVEALMAQLEQFEMASKRDAEDLQAIRNTAYYARPASSQDTSKFAIPKQELFEYQAHVLDG
jgi:SpoVK/Ycf46/Vps4 family AAA+-type ATPase